MADYFVVVTPGIEPITLLECQRLGLEAQVEVGGVTIKGGPDVMYKANYYLRTANRVLVRVGQPFMARSFEELGQKSAALPWENWITPNCALQFHVSSSRSKLLHTGVIAKFVARAIQKRLQTGEMVEGETQGVHIRIHEDKVTISLDSSGELLYRRGYRQQVTKSPMRETLAAALILASGWDGRSALVDPFCGSGTIPIEAALIAKNIPAGAFRNFSFEHWPGFDKAAWKQVKQAGGSAAETIPPIYGFDRDAGAIEISRANAERAGVAGAITFACQAISHFPAIGGIGWVVTNPPYGVRISEGNDLRNLYAQMGKVLRAQAPGWNLALVTNDIRLSGHSGLRLENGAQVSNGGITTTFQTCVIPQ